MPRRAGTKWERQLHKMSDAAVLGAEGISGKELNSMLEALPARKRVVILDACNSGQLIEQFARRGAAEERALKQLARSSGTFIMSATDSKQFASEVKSLGHGVFTYALLSAMSAAPQPRERMVLEIIDTACRMTPELSQKHRGEPQYPMLWSAGQNFPLLVR